MLSLRLDALAGLVIYGGLIFGTVWLFGWQSVLIFSGGLIVGLIGASS